MPMYRMLLTASFVRVLLSSRLPSEFRLSFTRMARISNAFAFMSSNLKPASVAGFRSFGMVGMVVTEHVGLRKTFSSTLEGKLIRQKTL